MCRVSFILLLLSFTICESQNNLRLYSADGRLFSVFILDKKINETPQTDFLIENISDDTVRLKIQFDDQFKYPATFYLLDKGKKTLGKEFDYRVELTKNKIKVDFTGIYDALKLPEPLVPVKPVIDTSLKYKNKRLGHFCELKDNTPVYFNNLPKEGDCKQTMPTEYLSYVGILMSKAEVPDDKFQIVDNTVRNNCINVAQLKALLGYIEYDLEKLKLVKTAYPSVTDWENRKQLEQALRFESSIQELNHFFDTAESYKINREGNPKATGCQSAATDKDVQHMNDYLSTFSNDAQRLESLKKVYTDHCYSTTQVKSILNKFIHDREKLDAARLLYFYTTDKTVYLNISDVFSYNQSAAELQDFIEKQTR
jgi:hypothetical protein